MQISLGKCHYGDFEEVATAPAVSRDGTGWIPVCDEHRDRAERDGYLPGERIEPPEGSEGRPADEAPADGDEAPADGDETPAVAEESSSLDDMLGENA